MSRIFIGIPTYNRPEYVEETIESLLCQNYGDWRAIVSDNASPESKATEKVRQYVEGLNDDRISFYLQPVNEGEYGQGRYFIDSVKDEEYFMILHDDDLLDPDYLKDGVAILEREKDAAFFFADPVIIDSAGEVSEKNTDWYRNYHRRAGKSEGLLDVLSHHLESGIAPVCATLFRTKSLVDSGFVDEGMTGNFPFEVNIFLRLGEQGTKAYYLPKSLIKFRFHPGSLRKDGLLMQNERIVNSMVQLFAKRQYDGQNEHRRCVILACCYRSLAIIQIKNGTTEKVRELLWKSYSTHNSIKNACYCILGCIHPSLIKIILKLSKNEIANPT